MSNRIYIKKFVKEYLFNNNRIRTGRSKKDWFVNNNYEQEYYNILELTNFLPENIPFRSRLYCIVGNIIEPNKCKYCGFVTKFSINKNNFNDYCSHSCSNRDRDQQKIVKKIKQTKKERYGDENYCNVDKIQRTKDGIIEEVPLDPNIMTDETFDAIKLLSSKDRISSHIMNLNKNIIEKQTKEIDFLTPSLRNRTRYLLYPPENGIYCSCGSPKVFSMHGKESFKPTCGKQSCASTAGRRNKKPITHKKSYTLEEQKEYVKWFLGTDTHVKAILRKEKDICLYMKEQAKKLDMAQVQYCYHLINDIPLEQQYCECGKKLRFVHFETGYNKGCHSCYMKKFVREKSDRAIKNVKEIVKEKNLRILKSGKLSDSPWILQCNECDHIFERWFTNKKKENPICQKCHPRNKSTYEYDLIDAIKQFYGGKVVHELNIRDHNTGSKRKSIDLYIPEFNLGIEVNGLYWHSVDHDKVDKRHIEKIEMCKEEGITLLQFTDLELDNSNDICTSIIKNKMNMSEKIPARKTKVKEISHKEYQDFCIENHLKGYSPAKIKYGLFYENELVMVIGLSKSRYTKESSSYELIRLCSKLDTNVIGGFSKLLSHIRKNCLEIEKIESFCDLTHGTGNGYETVGFEFQYNTQPNYYYYKANGGGNLESRLKFQKHKLGNILENFDPSLTEKQNMLNNGYRIYYDCGNAKYEMIF